MPPAGGDYRIDAQSYLARCRRRLLDGTPESLFYAAFELRCCVEARLAEYVEYSKPFAGRKVQLFKIGENAKAGQQNRDGETIAELAFWGPAGFITREYHTPVPVSLKQFVEKKIDALRHAQARPRGADDTWWATTRRELTIAYRSAWIACQGSMPVPPVYDKTGGIHPMLFSLRPENREPLQALRALTGTTIEVAIRYLDAPPTDWVCDLP